jgi:AbrB family looped-hinge helix DNA binding protein
MQATCAVSTVTSKGQVTIPLAIRKVLGIHPGTRLEFVAEGNQQARLVCKNASANDLPLWTPPSGVHLSLEDMDHIIGKAAEDSLARLA